MVLDMHGYLESLPFYVVPGFLTVYGPAFADVSIFRITCTAFEQYLST